jgi:O-antigen ligase
MLAASRAAMSAAMVGTLVIVAVNFKRSLVLSFVILSIATIVAIMPAESLNLAAQLLPSSLTEGLANKSWNNSREQHWNARWEEFLSAPATGIGFAAAWEGTVGVDDEAGTVETGSSYVSILSMTGFVGAAAWLAFAASTGHQLLRNWRRLGDRDRLATCGIGGFWLVHLGAEGYVYAVGSLIGVTFWLWLGCLNDQLCMAQRRPKRLKKVAAQPVARSNGIAALAMTRS